jgi:hypothetical protein
VQRRRSEIGTAACPEILSLDNLVQIDALVFAVRRAFVQKSGDGAKRL